MYIELNSTNLFYCSIIENELKYTRKVSNRLYTIKVPVGDKLDAFNKLEAISKTPDGWFVELSELASRVAKSESEAGGSEIS